MSANLMLILPEIILIVAAFAILMLGVFSKNFAPSSVWFALLAIAVALGVVLGLTPKDGAIEAFDGLFVRDRFTMFNGVLVLGAAGSALLMARNWMIREGLLQFEYSALMLLASSGMLMMLGASDLMSVYMGLELQSLSLYVMAAYNRDDSRSTEAGLKYFVLGAVASGVMLYGVSLVYGFAGTTSFAGIAKAVAHGHAKGAIIGLVFIVAGLSFKVAAVPFHMWTPDVYQGAPTPVTAFFAVGPKIAAFALLIKVMIGPFGHMAGQWQDLIAVLAAASTIWGAFAALTQKNIKRMLAYSSIGHAGYALIGLAAANAEGVRGVLVYLAIYLFMNAGTFAIVLAMRQKGKLVEDISDLAGLSKSQPGMALALAVFMFSMAGIPPLAGFFGKFYVFLAAINAGLFKLAVIGVLSSVVGAFYYIRIVKIMYFDEQAEGFDGQLGKSLSTIMAGSAVLMLVFFLIPQPLVVEATKAANVLFGG